MRIFNKKIIEGLESICVENGYLELIFLPQFGGRLISLKVSGKELLWKNPKYLTPDLRLRFPLEQWPILDGTMASWVNLGGSKTWPAPQGWGGKNEWAGPPDAVLDSGNYQEFHKFLADGTFVLELTSKCDEKTGLQICRRFEIPMNSKSFTQKNLFRNISHEPRTWSIWEVTQVDTNPVPHPIGKSLFKIAASEIVSPVVLFKLVDHVEYSIRESHFEIEPQNVIGKLGFASATGTAEWIRSDGRGLIMQATRTKNAIYPDGGCPVELWFQYPLAGPLPELGGLHPDANLVEMELLAPLITIEPNQSTEQTIQWICK
jgi:hypothetical protein